MIPRSRLRARRETAPAWFRGFCLVLGVAAFAAPLGAQNLLCADNDGKLEVVRRAGGNTTFMLEGGKAVPREGSHFVLKPALEYLPVFINVRDQHFQKGGRAISDEGSAKARLVNAGRFVFTADLVATRALDDVVLALALESTEVGNNIYLKGIGHLNAHEIKRISIDEITAFRLLGVRLAGVHLFVGGQEAFNPTITATKWETVLDRMVATHVAAGQNAELKPLYISDPVYPPVLKNKIPGKAVVVCEVDEKGKVVNPSVATATNPAFGPAAIEAVRQWRFVPLVKDGHPVVSRAEVPLDFVP